MRVTEVGLGRRARLAAETCANLKRSALVGIQFEADLVQSLARMNEFVNAPDLVGDLGENAIGEQYALLDDNF